MDSVPNSDSEHCTESRLGQVHSVHTPMAQAARWTDRIVAHQALCRGRVAAHARLYRTLCVWAMLQCPRPPRVVAPPRGLLRSVSQAPRSCRRPAQPYRSTTARRVVACLTIHLKARPPSCHDTNDCIVTHPTSQAARACTATCPCALSAIS